jgi:hypothetical protein
MIGEIKMKKKNIFCFIISICFTLSIFICVDSNINAYTSVPITFSNIGTIGSTMPNLYLENTSISALVVNGYPMVKIIDFAGIMGATLSYSGNDWFIVRNLQTTLFINGSTTVYTSNVYEYYDPVNNTTDQYSHTWSGALPVAPQIIDGYKYIPLMTAALQTGALMTATGTGTYYVFDFRINGTSPFSDANEYIVGGDWLSIWSTYADTHLADHFEIHEMWSNTGSGHEDPRQLKIAVASLESGERVRHYINNDSSLTISSAFRSWKYNKHLNGWDYSVHMRGRAWDAPADALYSPVYNEFRNGQSTPIDLGAMNLWRSRVPTTSNTRGYEIEKMPRDGSTWLHLVREPGTAQNSDRP